MAKKKPIPTETRLEVRLAPHVADQLKETAKETGISLNQLMKSVCEWTTANMHVGKPRVDGNLVLGSEPRDGMFWIGHNIDDKTHSDGDVYAIFDFSTSRAIRNPQEFFYSEENPYD